MFTSRAVLSLVLIAGIPWGAPAAAAPDPAARARELVARWKEGRFDPPAPRSNPDDPLYDPVRARAEAAKPRLTRARALAELRALGEAAEAPLRQVYRELPPEEGRAALLILGELRTRGALAALVEAAGSAAQPLRLAAAEALGEFGEAAHAPTVTPVVLQLARDDDPAVARTALFSLIALAPDAAWPRLLAQLEEELEEGRLGLEDEHRAERLSVLVDVLAEVLTRHPATAKVEAVFRAAVAQHERDADPSAEGAPAASAATRQVVAVLERSRAPLLAPYMRTLLWGSYLAEDEEIPAVAAGELPAGLDPFAVEASVDVVWALATPLFPLAPATKIAALEALGRGRQAGDLELCRRALRDEEPEVRRAALGQLRALVPAGARARYELFREVAQLLVDPDRSLRARADRWLSQYTGAKIGVSYRRWAEHLMQAGERARAREVILAELARGGVDTSAIRDLDRHLAGQGYESLEQYVELEYGHDSLAAFLAQYEEEAE